MSQTLSPATRTSRDYSDSVYDTIRQAVESHNTNKSWEYGYYIIDTTGKHRVFFTLYRYNNRMSASYGNPYRYIKNVSIDLLDIVDTIKRLPSPVIVNSDDNNNPLLINFRKRTKEGIPAIPFGKYKGSTIAQVWEQDRNWILWFTKNYKTQPYTDFRGRQALPKLTEEDVLLKQNAEELVQIFWDEMTEKNRQECTSKHFGSIKDRVVIEATVVSVRDLKITISDSEGNLFLIYDKDFNLVAKDSITVKGTVTNHFEKLGKDITYLNRTVVTKK